MREMVEHTRRGFPPGKDHVESARGRPARIRSLFLQCSFFGETAEFDFLLVGHLFLMGGYSGLVKPSCDESGRDELPGYGFRDP